MLVFSVLSYSIFKSEKKVKSSKIGLLWLELIGKYNLIHVDSFVLAIVSTINILVLITILSKTYCASRVVNSALLMYFIESF